MDAFYLTPNSAEFRLYSTPEILQLSVKEIKFSQTFDLLSNPVVGGLHDPALGKCLFLNSTLYSMTWTCAYFVMLLRRVFHSGLEKTCSEAFALELLTLNSIC